MIDTDEKVSVEQKSPIRKVAVYGLLWIFSLFICLVVGVVSGRVWQYSLDQEYALSSLAARLEVENDPEIIRNTVYCQLLDLGISKASVEQALNNIGSYQDYDAWNGAILIVFDDYFTRLTIHDLVLRFEDDKLIEKRYEVTPDSTIPIECP